MAEERPKIISADDARKELAGLSKPARRANSHTLPFGDLSDDEFEVLCYVLLKLESPGDEIFYYGRTGDLGRDILHKRADGSSRLIQCKKYSVNVGVADVRAEFAKLVVNVFEGDIPQKPEEVCFYVSSRLSGEAIKLIEDQAKWLNIADSELKKHLGRPPSKELLEFAMSWWPLVLPEEAISLTFRCTQQQVILDEFFGIQQVVVGNPRDVAAEVCRQIEPVLTLIRKQREPVAPELESIGNATIQDAFARASRSLLNWPTTLGNNRWLDRPEFETIKRHVDRESSTSLLLGARGAGKSALLAKFGKMLHDQYVPVLAIKADFLPRTVDTEAKLSEWLQLPSLATDCIAEVSQTKPVVILIDQLDALGDLVDLHSERLNVILNVIARLHGRRNVHLILSCREFEHRHDVRLTSIEAESISLELPPWETVVEILKAERSIDASGWSESLQNSLRVPQHLKMLLDLLEGNKEYDVSRSYQQVLDDVWAKHVTNSDGPTGRSKLLLEMARQMADQEVLWVPIAQFDDQQNLIASLESADILHRPATNSTIGFRHQTLFEHALARSFAAGHSELAPYVLERQNALFVRPILWSTLRYLRETSAAQYEQVLTALHKSELRLHVKYLLIEFLGQVDGPTDFEHRFLQPFLDDRHFRGRVLISIADNEGWFLRYQETHVPVWMDLPEEDVWPVVMLLRSASIYAPERCLELVLAHWMRDSARDALTFNYFRDLAAWDKPAVDTVCSIVARTGIDDHFVIHMAEVISSAKPELAPRLISTYLKRKLSVADARPAQVPPPLSECANEVEQYLHRKKYDKKRDYEELIRRQDSYYDLPAIAEAAPKEFLKEVWPWLVEVLEKLLEPPNRIVHSFRDCFLLELELDSDSMVNNGLILAIDDSIKSFAKTSPPEFEQFLDIWLECDADVIQRFLCRGLTEAAGELRTYALDFLVNDPRRLSLGGREDHHGDTRALIRALVGHLTSNEMLQLEAAVVNWSAYVEHIEGETPEDRLKRNKWSRERRLRLLKTLPFDRLTPETQALVNAESVALPEYRDYDHERVRLRVVGSPMTAKEMSHARDEHVLNLFDELIDSTGADHPRQFGRGGADQASQELGRLAESEPERVASLLRKFKPTQHQKPAARAIGALGRNKEFPTSALFSLIVDLDKSGFQSGEFRSEAGHACFQRANEEEGLPDSIISLLTSWLKSWGDWDYYRDEHEQEDEKDEKELRSLLWSQFGYVYPHGSFWILLALTYGYLRREPPQRNEWLSMLVDHLERPESNYSWKIFAEELRFLNDCDPERSTAILLQLFEKYPKVRDSRFGVVLTANCRFFVPCETYHQMLLSIRDSNWRLGRQALGELLGLSYLAGEFPEWTEFEVREGVTDASISRGLAYAVAHLWWEDADARTLAIALFERLASTSDRDTAQALMAMFVKDESLPAHRDTVRLLEAVASNTLLIKNAPDHWFVEKLEEIITYCPDLVCRICNQIVDVLASELADIRTSASRSSSNLVNISMTLQRLYDYRDRGLELFERLLQLGVYDASSLLKNLDSRPINVPPSRSPRKRRRRSTAKEG